MYSSKEKGIWTSLASVQNAFKSALSKEIESPVAISTPSNSMDKETTNTQNDLNRSYQKILKPPTESAPSAPTADTAVHVDSDDNIIDKVMHKLYVIHALYNSIALAFLKIVLRCTYVCLELMCTCACILEFKHIRYNGPIK